jgi:hypothetical protein
MSWVYFVLRGRRLLGLYGRRCTAAGSRWPPLRAAVRGHRLRAGRVLVPVTALSSQGQMSGFSRAGVLAATWAASWAQAGPCASSGLRAGGTPAYVMPLVFAGAPVVNVLYSMWQHPPKSAPSPILPGLRAGRAGRVLVLHYKPQG